MQNQQQSQYNDEIDLKNLILALWQGKWIIIACVVFALVAAMAYLKLVPQTYKGKIKIDPLTSAQMLPYQPAFQLEGLKFDSDTLLKALSDSLADPRPLNNAGGGIIGAALSKGQINFTTNSPENARAVWQSALPEYELLAASVMSREYDAMVSGLSSSIEKLEHQIHLAKVAGIDVNGSPLITAETLPYIRGYKVLEAEVDLLKQQASIGTNPFNQDAVIVANYNLDIISLQPKVKPTLLLALSFVLGGMLGVFILIIRNVLRDK